MALGYGRPSLKPCQCAWFTRKPLVQNPNPKTSYPFITTMLILHTYAPPLPFTQISNSSTYHLAPFPAVKVSIQNITGPRTSFFIMKAKKLQREVDKDEEKEEAEKASRGRTRGKEQEKDYDRDPEFAEILGSCLDDPQKARSKVSC